jgi:hypothetical protein
MSKPWKDIKHKAKRVTCEIVYRVRWSAGDVDLPNQERADEHAARLMAAGIAVQVDSFRRSKQ